jgi:hypothetical protein
MLQDISGIKIPEDYPFPASLDGRGKDFKYVASITRIPSCSDLKSRACWFMATHEDVRVSTIPVSEVINLRDIVLNHQLMTKISSIAKNTAALERTTFVSHSAKIMTP